MFNATEVQVFERYFHLKMLLYCISVKFMFGVPELLAAFGARALLVIFNNGLEIMIECVKYM
jgi:hypothetical protein